MRREIENILEVIRRSYLAFEEYEEMEQALHQALETYPDDPDLEDELLEVLRLQHKLIAPELVVRQNLRQVTELMQGEQYANAVPLLLHVRGLEQTAQVSDLLGFCYYKLGDYTSTVVVWHGELERIVKRCIKQANYNHAEFILSFIYHQQADKTPDVIRLLYEVYIHQEDFEKSSNLVVLHSDVLEDEEEIITEDGEGVLTDTDIDLGSSDGDNVEMSAIDMAEEIASRILDGNKK